MQLRQGQLVVDTKPGEVLHETPRLIDGDCIQTVEAEPFTFNPPAYIYHTTDPFRSEVDQANADCAVDKRQPRWVRRTWFFLHVLLPLFWIGVVGLVSLMVSTSDYVEVIATAVTMLPYSATFWLIWKKSGATTE